MSQNDHDHVWKIDEFFSGAFCRFMKCEICNVIRPAFQSSYKIVFPIEVTPGQPDGPYIEFSWRYGEKPKRYLLEPLVEKLAQMGILQEIKEG